ncbi:hypothetical protein NLG97_g3971 [Lecanicillium saksenae]|uniref:Uncharacterized protein n=1 Tax=Lecanicillium saksenae TaxID=468837 RepID=A0ACC1QWL1_9HYPO|nr:hypothetical protein NLG97_g3971 [Lecanicillium saksenae]
MAGSELSQKHKAGEIEASAGNADCPIYVDFESGDPRNPLNFSVAKKWLITSVVTTSVFAVTLTSSAYSASSEQILAEFHSSKEVFALGITLFVLGFAVGPPLWAPISELYGRRILFVASHALIVAFVAATAGCTSMPSLLAFRLLAGIFGASPLTNSGGVIADMFPHSERGLAMAVFAAAPFMGPMLGPVIGGFVTITIGWRWLQGVCCIFIAAVWIIGIFVLPETYVPVILSRKARQLERETGVSHSTIYDDKKLAAISILATAFKRPWVLLFLEPIVLIASTYMAILYGTIYMFMGAFPIVYESNRGWDQGIGGLAFLGLTVGMLLGLIYTIIDNKVRYNKLGEQASPECRLPPARIGAIALPVGMFAFAWTNGPSIHWSASIILSTPFGFGCVLVFLSYLNYLIDSYTLYAASVLAAGAMLRSFFGAVFPLFVSQMYEHLGIHWASSIPAFLTLICVPFPFLMYIYGAQLRMRCKYAQKASALMATTQAEPQSDAPLYDEAE